MATCQPKLPTKRSEEEDIFVVNPGPVFHFKEIKIVGLPELLAQQALKDAPKCEVYSAARVNDSVSRRQKTAFRVELFVVGLRVKRRAD